MDYFHEYNVQLFIIKEPHWLLYHIASFEDKLPNL